MIDELRLDRPLGDDVPEKIAKGWFVAYIHGDMAKYRITEDDRFEVQDGDGWKPFAYTGFIDVWDYTENPVRIYCWNITVEEGKVTKFERKDKEGIMG